MTKSQEKRRRDYARQNRTDVPAHVDPWAVIINSTPKQVRRMKKRSRRGDPR